MNPFDFVREIQSGKKDIMTDDLSEKDYVPFVVNKALSYEMDCVLQANEMNQRHHLDKKLQFAYLLNTVRSRKRPFHKWIKPETSDVIDAIKHVFTCSDRKAYENLRVLTKEQVEHLKLITQKGGRMK